MAISTSYLNSYAYKNMLNSYYSKKNTKGAGELLSVLAGNSSSSSSTSSIFGSSSDSLADIVQRYSYFKSNYSTIREKLNKAMKGEDIEETSWEELSQGVKKDAKTTSAGYLETRMAAGELKDSANALSDSKIYEADSEGNYNRDVIKSAVKSFIEDYNKVKEIGGDSKNDQVVKNVYQMVSTTKGYTSVLGKIGINIKSDNTLELDEKQFDSATVHAIKSVFDGNYSFGSAIAKKSGDVKDINIGSYLKSTTSSSLLDYLA